MSNSKNSVSLIGRVGKDVEMTRTGDNLSVSKTSLATSERYKDKSGEYVEQTEWHNLVFFGKLAETAEKYVKKGDLIGVEGRLKTGSWEKEGVKHSRTEVIVEEVIFLTNKKQTEEQPQATAPAGSPVTGRVPETEDDLPF